MANTAGLPTTLTDRVLNAARDLPSMLNAAEAADPATADKWTGKALIFSKTPWGTLAVAGVAWVSGKYGFGWDANTCDLIGGAGLIVGAYLMRLVTELPITGIFSKATVAQVVVKAASAGTGA
jgi:hypothetical protein